MPTTTLPRSSPGPWSATWTAAATAGGCTSSPSRRRKDGKLEDGMVIEEGSIPGGLGKFLPGAFTFANEAVGRETGHGIRHRIEEKKQELTSLVEGAHHGAVRRSQTYLVMAHDSGSG